MFVSIPGAGVNHSPDPNATMISVKDGFDWVSTRDIKKGEFLRHDYRTYGSPPQWFIDYLEERTGNSDCVFQGFNDYV